MGNSLNKIKKLLESIKETEVKIHDDVYNRDEVINFARKFDPTVITLKDALDRIRRMELFSELKRVLKDKDGSYNY